MAIFHAFSVLLHKTLYKNMAKKKKTTANTAKSFSEAVGIKNILGNDIINFLFGTFLLFVAIYVIIAFVSYFNTGQADQSIVLDMRPGEILNSHKEFENYCGSIGALLSWFFIARCFGLSAFLIPVFLGLTGLRMMKVYKVNLLKWFLSLMIIMLWCSVTFAKFLTPIMGDQVYNPGGDHGRYICQFIQNLIGPPGLTAVLALTALFFLTYLSAETIEFIRKAMNPVKYVSDKVKFTITNVHRKEDEEEANKQDASPIETEEDPEVFDDPATQIVEFDGDDAKAIIEENYGSNAEAIDLTDIPVEKKADESKVDSTSLQVTAAREEEKADGKRLVADVDLSTPINPREPWTRYKFPTLDLLAKYESDGKPFIDMEEQTANKNRIVEVLNNFGVQISTIKATVGPTITLYEITPAQGVRISRIRNLEDDIALSLSALGIRIIAPIPGKGTIGIEVPNKKPNIVSMESILNSKKFQDTTMELPIALGKTITNEVYMVDLAKIPHLLVAGATGQGKSVGLNAIITSLLYKKHPNELKIVLIDPKKVEFSVYGPIEPHFMAKVEGDGDDDAIITDVTKVVRTLNSLCQLMDHRYDMLKLAGTRNVKEYNKKFVNHELSPEKGHEYMPYIVVIIDEFGDLIMTAGKEVELPIARIAQLARAVGIHMVIATQRPTTNIITGTIKANFPGRMAFKVSSMIDSRTILDRPGANQLIGRGDMLILNGNDPVRVQCAFVDTPEVERINQYIASQPGPLAPLELPEPMSEEGEGIRGGDISSSNLDPLFEDAARAIVLAQQGSTSMIQRRFAIGFNRAGRLMDQLECAGIVGATQGSKPREVLIQDENSLTELLARIK